MYWQIYSIILITPNFNKDILGTRILRIERIGGGDTSIYGKDDINLEKL